MTMAVAIAQVAHTFPGAPLHSPAYRTADGSMPFHMFVQYMALLPTALAHDRLNMQRALIMADQMNPNAAALQDEALTEAYPA